MILLFSLNLFILIYAQRRNEKRSKIYGEWTAWEECTAPCNGGKQVKRDLVTTVPGEPNFGLR